MKIEDRNAVSGSAATRTSEAEAAQSAAKAKSSSSYSRTGIDSVELSGISQSVHSFAAARDARVAQLSNLVRSGSYSVSPALIGRSLVAETLAAGAEPSAK